MRHIFPGDDIQHLGPETQGCKKHSRETAEGTFQAGCTNEAVQMSERIGTFVICLTQKITGAF